MPSTDSVHGLHGWGRRIRGTDCTGHRRGEASSPDGQPPADSARCACWRFAPLLGSLKGETGGGGRPICLLKTSVVGRSPGTHEPCPRVALEPERTPDGWLALAE